MPKSNRQLNSISGVLLASAGVVAMGLNPLTANAITPGTIHFTPETGIGSSTPYSGSFTYDENIEYIKSWFVVKSFSVSVPGSKTYSLSDNLFFQNNRWSVIFNPTTHHIAVVGNYGQPDSAIFGPSAIPDLELYAPGNGLKYRVSFASFDPTSGTNLQRGTYKAIAAPGPLPILGLGAFFAYSRNLRKRIKSTNPEVISTTAV